MKIKTKEANALTKISSSISLERMLRFLEKIFAIVIVLSKNIVRLEFYGEFKRGLENWSGR